MSAGSSASGAFGECGALTRRIRRSFDDEMPFQDVLWPASTAARTPQRAFLMEVRAVLMTAA